METKGFKWGKNQKLIFYGAPWFEKRNGKK
jgi:hypothetical protein